MAEREGRDSSKYLSNYVFVGGPGTGKTVRVGQGGVGQTVANTTAGSSIAVMSCPPRPTAQQTTPPTCSWQTVARIMAKVLNQVGVLASDVTVEVSANDLQAGYIGQTKDKLNDVFRQAQGGVLFIDEAYSLGRGSFGKEAEEQLTQLCTSPDHLNKTVVILAGYREKMDKMLATTNPGIRSRFTARLEFADWSPADW